MSGSKISIVIPAYNCSKSVADAIGSVLSQTYHNFEIIVVDDGSTDETANIIKNNFSDERVRYFYQKNQGPGAARNSGMRLSEGNYICFLDADDLMKPDSLKVRFEAINSRNDLMMIFSDYSYFDNEKKYTENRLENLKFLEKLENLIVSRVNDVFIFDKRLIERYFLLTPYPIWTGTVFMRKNIIDSVGFFRCDLKVSEDTDYWIRIIDKFFIGYVNKSTAVYNHHLSSLTNNNDEIYYCDRIRGLKSIRYNSRIVKKSLNRNISNSYYELGYKYYHSDKRLLSIKQYCKGFIYNYRNIKCIKGIITNFVPLPLVKILKSYLYKGSFFL